MQEILSVLNSATPFGVIGLLVIVVYKLIVGEDFLAKIRGTQEEKYPSLEKHYDEISRHLEEINDVYAEQRKFRENHSMHEIPEIRDSINRIETKVDKMADAQVAQGLDIARLKALSEK